jgi:general secretion pathway protein A
MYLDFFGLHEQPFGVTPDPAFLYLSQTHREAMAAFRSGLVTDRGFMALVGEPGLGKTTLLYRLMDEWRESSRVAFLFQTQCDSRDFFRYLLAELGVDAESMGLVAMHHHLNHVLFQEMLAGKRFILIVDEAQNLDNSVLETVRLLSNFETQHAKLLNIVLAGQPQLAEKLETPGLRQLRQRISVMCRVRPLTPTETTEYIKHRLNCAGHRGEAIFTSGALQAIAKGSEGTPRTINNICHQALCAAVLAGSRTVNLDIVQNVIAKLEGREIEVAPAESAPSESAPSEVEVPAKVEASAPPAVPVAQAPIPAAAPATPLVMPIARPAVPVAPGTVARPAQTSGAPMLSYGVIEKKHSKRWPFAAIICCVALLAATSFAIPSARQFAKQGYENLTVHALAGAPSSSANLGPESSSRSAASAFDPAPQESDSGGQIITVATKAGQTIEELSRLYAGYYDSELYQQISALNPDLKDPDNLEAGQLIRLPLPPGTLKKVVDTADPSDTPPPSKLESAITKVKDLFAPAKH